MSYLSDFCLIVLCSACPGRDFSEAVLRVIMSSVLHAFAISPALDEHGIPLPLEGKMSDGGVLS